MKAPTASIDKDYHVPNLERAFRIMEFLARYPEGCGISEIAEKLELPINSVFRILKSLHRMGYLNESGKSYHLSTKLLALGYAALGEANIVEKALDLMRELRDEINETVLLGILTGNEGVILEQVTSAHSLNFTIGVGHHFTLHTAAPGKVLLAFLPEREREHLLRQIEYTRYTERTITSREELKDALEGVRDKGYAVDFAERIEGMHCVAAPIFNHRSYPVAALWVVAPSFRMPPAEFDRIGRAVSEIAVRTSRRFGYEPDLARRPDPVSAQQ